MRQVVENSILRGRRLVTQLFLVLLISFLATGISVAQITLTVKDTDQKVVDGAVVTAVGSKTGESFSGITNLRGSVTIEGLSLPAKVQISHISFEDKTLDITRDGQHEVLLKPDLLALDQVIITGQHEPQSINKSVYTVQSIGQKRIESQGAVDLVDVLSNNLNITLTPNKTDGRTSISMLGLDGQYVKVLIDGIPFAGIEGNGNNADISQINVNTIDRIEIVEGPMAVSYGSNAVAGVINIITKKSADIRVTLQEETAGNEYGLEQGRRIQSLNFGHQLTDDLLLTVDYLRNDFKGFRGVFEGKDHLLDNNLRGFDWHPKIQNSVSTSLNYSSEKFSSAYRFNYFHQELNRFSSQVFLDEHPATGITNPFALDDDNVTKRFVHQLNLSGRLGTVNYSILSAFTGVDFTRSTFNRRLLTNSIESVITETSSVLNSFTSRGSFTNLVDSKSISLEAGYEFTGESISNSETNDGQQRGIDNMAVFSSLEWSVLENLKIRPGVRVMHNNKFDTPLIYSINTKYNAPKDIELRASFGRSYRTPNLTELFFFFVDANHDVRGNENLVPEDGYGGSLDLKRRSRLATGWSTTNFKIFYNDISDQITLGVVNEQPLQFQYINIDRYKSKGFTISNQFAFQRFSLNAGFSLIGRYNDFNEEDDQLVAFLYAPEVNLNATVNWPSLNLTTAFFYKQTGRVEQYVLGENDEFVKGKTDAFNWLDFTTTWNPVKKIQITGGVRNIFNIANVQTTAGTAGAHSAAPTAVGLSYGRSYFLRLAYNFK